MLRGAIMLGACVMVHNVCIRKAAVVIVLKVFSATVAQVHRHAEFVHAWCVLLNHVVIDSVKCMCSYEINLHCCWVKKNVRWGNYTLLLGIVSDIYLLALEKLKTS